MPVDIIACESQTVRVALPRVPVNYGPQSEFEEVTLDVGSTDPTRWLCRVTAMHSMRRRRATSSAVRQPLFELQPAELGDVVVGTVGEPPRADVELAEMHAGAGEIDSPHDAGLRSRHGERA